MINIERLQELKGLLDSGALTREEFDELKQKEMQVDEAGRGSDRSVSPVLGAPVGGLATTAATGSAAQSTKAGRHRRSCLPCTCIKPRVNPAALELAGH